MLVLCLLAAGCTATTGGGNGENTEAVTATADIPRIAQSTRLAPTFTAVPTEKTGGKNCQSDFTETFDSANGCWTLGSPYSVTDLASPDSLDYSVTNGEFLINATANEPVYLYWLKDDWSYQDVNIEADVIEHEKSNNNNNWLLACETSDQGWYEVRLQPAGLYSVYMFQYSLRQAGKNPYVLIKDGGAKSILTGVDRVNTMAFKCNQDKLSFSLNGELIWSGTAPEQLPEGGIALGIATSPDQYPSHYAFQEVRVNQ